MIEVGVVKSKIESIEYKAIWDDILQLDINACAVTVCLASIIKSETLPRFQRLLMSEKLITEFRNIIRYMLKKQQNEWRQGELEFPEFSAESIPFEFEIEHLDLSEYNNILEQLNPLQSLTSVDVFEEEEDFVSGLHFYVIVAQPSDGEPIYFFHTHSPKKALARSRTLAIWKNQGSYDRVNVPIFLFDENIDCMSRSSVMFLFNKSNFQNIFRCYEEVKKTAKETLNVIKTCVPIENFDEFERDCENHLWKLKKLRRIAAKPYLRNLTIQHIKDSIEKHNLSIALNKVNGQEMIVYNSRDKWTLLKLLDDDYLWSILTEQSYEVNGKREVSPKD